MPPLIKGKEITLYSDTNGFTQGQGYFRRVEYHALKKELLYTKQGQLIGAGYNCVIDKMGSSPKWSLVGTTAGPRDGQQESPVERWTWRKELVQRDIFTKPEVAKEAREFSGQGGTNPGTYRQKLVDAISNGSAFPTDMSGLINAPQVFLELAAGADAYELEYLVLTRTRKTTSNFAPRIVLDSTSVIYTTNELIEIELIPDEVARVLPGGPKPVGSSGTNPSPTTTPGNAIWGWRTRDHEGDFEGNFRFAETTSWVFANWSMYLYKRYGT